MGTRTPEKPVELGDGEELERFVSEHERAVVEFYTAGCSLCAAIEPVLGNVARATDVAVGTCNPRDDPALISAYDVRSVPTLVRFEGGEPIDRLAEGFQGTERVLSFLGEA
jgi:thiol-disulfide isomerase/thioredoxin